MHVHTQFVTGVLLIQTQSSCLHSKHSYLLSHVLSPALASFTPVKYKLLLPFLYGRETEAGGQYLFMTTLGDKCMSSGQESDTVCVCTIKAPLHMLPTPWELELWALDMLGRHLPQSYTALSATLLSGGLLCLVLFFLALVC